MEGRGSTIDIFNFSRGRCRTYRQHPLGGPPSTSPTSEVAAAGPAASTPQGAHHRHLQLWWWLLPDMPPAPSKGPAIDIFNFNGGHSWTCRQHPLGGPPSTSSTSVVAATGPAASTPQGAHHRRLQLRWWLLSDMPPGPPRGPTIDIFNFSGGRSSTCRQHPIGVRHRRLQLWWWSLLEIPAAPLGGLPSTSFSTSVAAATGHVDSTPQGASHRCLPKLGTCCQNFSSDTYQGATAVNITTTSKAASRKSEGNSFIKIIFGSLRCQIPGIHITTTEVHVQINKLSYGINY
jgi:hypothetical protein